MRCGLPELEDPRHEAFAQHLALGEPKDTAYQNAGYRPHRGNAARLSANENVVARVRELMALSTIRTTITSAGLLRDLETIKDKCMSLELWDPKAAILAIKELGLRSGEWKDGGGDDKGEPLVLILPQSQQTIMVTTKEQVSLPRDVSPSKSE